MNGQEFLVLARSKFDEVFAASEACIEHTETALAEARPLLLAVHEEDAQAGSTTYALDLAIQKAAPVAVVPLYSTFLPLADNGHRFLLATDGLYIEVRRPWLYLVQRLNEQVNVSMPYGAIKPVTDLAFGRLGNILDHIRAFATEAIINAPNEHAAMLAWNVDASEIAPVALEITRATPSSLEYTLPPLGDNQSIAVDLHSHGNLSAFFSTTDDADDAGDVKIAGVLGNLDTAHPTALFRLCVLGLYIPIQVPSDKIFGGL